MLVAKLSNSCSPLILPTTRSRHSCPLIKRDKAETQRVSDHPGSHSCSTTEPGFEVSLSNVSLWPKTAMMHCFLLCLYSSFFLPHSTNTVGSCGTPCSATPSPPRLWIEAEALAYPGRLWLAKFLLGACLVVSLKGPQSPVL